MKKIIISITLFIISANIYANEVVYFFDFYGYIKEYSDITKPSFNDQLDNEVDSNFFNIYKDIKEKKYVTTFVGDSIGEIKKIIPHEKTFQCSLVFDNILHFFNEGMYNISFKNNSYFFDLDKNTNFFFTNCPIQKYKYLNKIIKEEFFNEFYFFINSHPMSIKIIEKLIVKNELTNYKVFIKNYNFLNFEDLNKFVFNKKNTILFFQEKEIIKMLKINNELKNKIMNQKVKDIPNINNLYNMFKNHYIDKNKNKNKIILKENIDHEFQLFLDQ